MSRSTHCDVCPYVLRIPEGILKELFRTRTQVPAEGGYEDDCIRGWIFNIDYISKVGRNRRISAHPWRKRDKVVHYVNESPYSSVGRESSAFVADNRSDLEEFAREMEFGEVIILENEAVQVTI